MAYNDDDSTKEDALDGEMPEPEELEDEDEDEEEDDLNVDEDEKPWE